MRVAVLGGGLQGACIALDLASSGVEVDVFEKHDRCLSQASAQNEGKIHLGYVYANDPSLATARAMIRGTIAFAPELRRWIGDAMDEIPVSDPFHYVVHADSLLDVAEVENHLKQCHALALAECGDSSPDYFGSDYREPPERLTESECSALFDRRTVKAAFRTAEIGVDPEALADAVNRRLETHPLVRCRLRTSVLAVEASGRSAEVRFETPEGDHARERYDHVVNSLWEGRLAIDRTAGIEPERPWLFRLKRYLRMPALAEAPRFPSTTVVLGAFGDAVRYANGASYLSWYPAGMRGMTSEIVPPDWRTTLDEPEASELRRSIFDALVEIVPGLRQYSDEAVAESLVRGGVIFAWGQTDIDDAESGLHRRCEIGPRSRGPYTSVDTGKLTMAPLFASQVAENVREARARRSGERIAAVSPRAS